MLTDKQIHGIAEHGVTYVAMHDLSSHQCLHWLARALLREREISAGLTEDRDAMARWIRLRVIKGRIPKELDAKVEEAVTRWTNEALRGAVAGDKKETEEPVRGKRVAKS